MSKINNRRKTQKEKKIRKENNNQKVGGQRKEIINKNKATEFYYLTVLYLEFQLVRTPPPLSRMYGALTPRMYGSISKTVVKERGENELWANTRCKSSVVKKWKTHDWLTTKKKTLIEVRSVLSSVTVIA